MQECHDDVIKWKHFPRNRPFVREIHRSPVNFPHKGQWRGALMFSLIYAWINDWVNNREAGDLRRQHGHYDVIVMSPVRYHSRYCRLALRHRYVVVNMVIFGPGNDFVACFAPSYHLTNAEILSNGPLGTNNEIRIKIQPFHARNYVWKWWPFRLGLNVLTLLIRHWPFCHFQWFRQFSRTSKSR